MKVLINGVEYTPSNKYSSVINESVSLTSETIKINTINVKIRSDKEELFEKGSEIIATDSDDTILGKFFIENAKLIEKDDSFSIYEVTGYDYIKYIEKFKFNGDYYNGTYKIKEILMQYFNILGVFFNIPTAIGDIKPIGYNPPGTLRDALQHIAFTYNLIVDTSRSLDINIKQESLESVGTIKSDSIFTNSIDTADALLKASTTTVNYTEPLETDANVELFKGKLLADDEIIVTFEPHDYFSITNGTILTYTRTSAKIKTSNAANETILVAKPYKKSEVSVSVGTGDEQVVVQKNTMINLLNYVECLQNIVDDYGVTHIENVKTIWFKYNCGDRIVIISKFGVMYGRIESQKISFGSTLNVSDLVIRGRLLPPQEVVYTPSEMYTNDEITVI